MSLAAAASGFIVFLLSVQVIQGQDGWRVTYTSTKICAVKGSTVEIHCSYTYPSSTTGRHAVDKTFWFTKMNGRDPVDLTTDPQYSGRVQYDCDKIRNYCTLRITDLRESDSAVYKFRFRTNELTGYTGSPGVTLSVTGLQVNRPYNWLKCQSSCVLDRPSFIWYKNGQKIQTEASSSYLRNYNQEDSYSCAVKGYEDSPSPPTCADGQTCNRVTYTDRNICAFKGSSVDISCTYSSYKNHVESKFWFSPERKDQWGYPIQPVDLSKDSQFAGRVQVIDTQRGRSTLRITDLRESDSAEYHFKFTTPSFEWRSSLPGTTLTVTALQVQVTRTTAYQSVTEAELKCHSSCSPAGRLSYVWFKNKVEITGVETSSYKARFGLSDNVSCAIRGHEEFPSPSVYAPKLPSVSVSPSAEIVEGSSVTLTCSSDANPAAKYTWYKTVNPRPLSEGPQLVFSSIQSSDSGQYYCTAENELGRRTSNDFTMDVKYAPRVPSVSVNPSGKIMEGSSVTLTCSSDANPAAKKTWYMENQKVLQGSDGVYQFMSISSEDRGKYYCTSENQHGQINSSPIFIDVQYAPKLPSVSVSPSAEMMEGDSVNLTCSSDANPAANYTWYKEDEDSPKASGQIFTITDIRAEHSGNYYCEAQNTRGRQISTLHLTVVAGAWKLAAAGTVSCVLLAILAVLAVFLWIRRKKALTQQYHGGERPDNGPQLNMGPVYDIPSAAAQTQPAEQQDELHYSNIIFPQNQEEALYSNVRPAQPHRHEDEDSGVEYTAVKTESASGAPGTRRQEDGEDLFVLYSTVKK